MLIRNYQASDHAAVLELLRLNTPAYFAPSEEKDLADFLAHHMDRYFVAELDGNILGCGGFNLAENDAVARISWDIVHPESQGKGVGSALTRHRIREIQQIESVKTISVRTSQLAYLFYGRFGFETKEVILDFWAEGFDMYRMERAKVLVNPFEDAFLEAIGLMDRRSVRYEVQRFPSGSAMIDIWLGEDFCVVQFGRDGIGFAMIDDDSGFELIPVMFEDGASFLKHFRTVLAK